MATYDDALKLMNVTCDRRDKAREVHKALTELQALVGSDPKLFRKCENLIMPAAALVNEFTADYNQAVAIFNMYSENGN